MFCPGVAILPNGDIVGHRRDHQQLDEHLRPGDEHVDARAADEHRARLPGPDHPVRRPGVHPGWLVVRCTRRQARRGLVTPPARWRELTDVPAHPIYTATRGRLPGRQPRLVHRHLGWNVFQAGPSKRCTGSLRPGRDHHPAGARGTSGDAMNGNAVCTTSDKIIAMGGAPSYQDSNAHKQREHDRHHRRHRRR